MKESTEQFGLVLTKYALSSPLSPDDQRYIVKQRKAGLKKLLRQKGAYGAFFLTLIGIKLFFQKFGITLSLIQAKIVAGATAAAVAAATMTGGYTAVRYVQARAAEEARRAEKQAAIEEAAQKKPAPALPTNRAIRDYYSKLEQVDLDDGTRLVGAVIYQDRNTVRIHTIHGIVEVPVSSVRSIRIK